MLKENKLWLPSTVKWFFSLINNDSAIIISTDFIRFSLTMVYGIGWNIALSMRKISRAVITAILYKCLNSDFGTRKWIKGYLRLSSFEPAYIHCESGALSTEPPPRGMLASCCAHYLCRVDSTLEIALLHSLQF